MQNYLKKNVKKEEMKEFFEKCNLEKVPEDMRKILNDLVNITEIKDAIVDAKLGKTLGPDGFSAKYYKTFKEELIPVLQILMNEIIRKVEIPNSWKEANITLIPKEGQNL